MLTAKAPVVPSGQICEKIAHDKIKNLLIDTKLA